MNRFIIVAIFVTAVLSISKCMKDERKNIRFDRHMGNDQRQPTKE